MTLYFFSCMISAIIGFTWLYINDPKSMIPDNQAICSFVAICVMPSSSKEIS